MNSLNTLQSQPDRASSVTQLSKLPQSLTGLAHSTALAALTVVGACSESAGRTPWADRVDPENCLSIAARGDTYKNIEDDHDWGAYSQDGPVEVNEPDQLRFNLSVQGRGPETEPIDLNEYAAIVGCTDATLRFPENTVAVQPEWADDTEQAGVSAEEVVILVPTPEGGWRCPTVDMVLTRDYKDPNDNCETVSFSVPEIDLSN